MCTATKDKIQNHQVNFCRKLNRGSCNKVSLSSIFENDTIPHQLNLRVTAYSGYTYPCSKKKVPKTPCQAIVKITSVPEVLSMQLQIDITTHYGLFTYEGDSGTQLHTTKQEFYILIQKSTTKTLSISSRTMIILRRDDYYITVTLNFHIAPVKGQHSTH